MGMPPVHRQACQLVTIYYQHIYRHATLAADSIAAAGPGHALRQCNGV